MHAEWDFALCHMSIRQLGLYVGEILLLLIQDYCLFQCVLAACVSEDLRSSERVALVLMMVLLFNL